MTTLYSNIMGLDKLNSILLISIHSSTRNICCRLSVVPKGPAGTGFGSFFKERLNEYGD